MKYALGTIVGTALLGLAKKQSGSSVKIRKMHIYTMHYGYYFGISPKTGDDLYWEHLIDNQHFTDETFNSLKNEFKKRFAEKENPNLQGVNIYINPDISFIDDYDDYDDIVDRYIWLSVDVIFHYDQNSVFDTNPFNVAEEFFNIEKNKLIKNMRERYGLEPKWERIIRNKSDVGTKIFIQRNGEWIPYKPPKSNSSNLRKR